MKANQSFVYRWLLAAWFLLVLACGFQSARAYYDPVAGHFLSADPLGHAASMDLHSFCNGDPINRFDPTGRFGKSAGPTWWDQMSRQIDNDNYGNSSAGQYMLAYQQTQADMASTLSWQREPPTWGEFFSSALNITPVTGGVKMWIEGGFTGKDMVTGQWVNRSSWETFFGVTGNALGTVGMMGGIMSEAAQGAKFANGFASWQARSSLWESQLGSTSGSAVETTIAQQTTILGENMTQRVMPFADQTGARTLGFGATQDEWAAMTPAERWKLNDGMLRARINEGDSFRYIGQDPLRNPAVRDQFDLTRSELLRLDSRNVPYETVPRPQVQSVIQRP